MRELIVHVVGWTVVHSLWQGAVVAIAAALALAVVPRRAVRVRYAILSLACIANLAAPLATAVTLAVQPTTPIATSVSMASRSAPPVVPNVDASTSASRIADASLGALSPRRQYEILGAASWLRFHLDTVLAVVVGIWIAGVLAGMARFAGGWLLVRRIITRATPAGRPLVERVRALATRIGLTRCVRVVVSEDVGGPFTTSVWRPVIVLPAAMLTGMDPAAVDAILLHELAHVRRWDYGMALVQSVATTLLFHHPVTWWLDRRLRIEREYCCDDVAASTAASRLRYARALATLEGVRAGLPSLAMAATDGSLLDRIERLVGRTRPPAPAPWGPALALVAVLGTTGALRAAEAPRDRAPVVSSPTIESPIPSRITPRVASKAADDLQARWIAAVANAGRAEVMIGWRVRAASRDRGIVVSSTDGSSRRGGPTVASVLAPSIGASADAPGVAILLAWSGAQHDIVAVRLRSMDAPIGSTDHAITWLGDADDASSIAQLERLMNESRDVAMRREMGAALSLHDDVARITAAVAHVLDTQPADVRSETLSWLGHHRADPRALALLQRGIADEAPNVRDEAISAIADDRTLLPLMRILLRTSPYADVRQEIAQRLSGNQDAVALLLDVAFGDPDADVQAEAVDSIKETPGRASRDALQRIADRHPSARLREEARDALAERVS